MTIEHDPQPPAIEGVETGTAGFAGLTRFGPVPTDDVPTRAAPPRLVTSFGEFERVFGGLEPLSLDDGRGGSARVGYLAHAVRAFFENGGRGVYIARVFVPRSGPDGLEWGRSQAEVRIRPGRGATWIARWPGAFGDVAVTVEAVRGSDCADVDPVLGVQARGVGHGAVVEVTASGQPTIADGDALRTGRLRLVVVDPGSGGATAQRFLTNRGAADQLEPGTIVREVILRVTVDAGTGRTAVYDGLAAHPAHPRWIGQILSPDQPADPDAVVGLDVPTDETPTRVFSLMRALTAAGTTRLRGGHDGERAGPEHFAIALAALGEIDEIAVVALPDASADPDPDRCQASADVLVAHVEARRDRIAVVDPPVHLSISEVQAFRAGFDSGWAALYHPWIEIAGDGPDAGGSSVLLPPSGFVAGVYARTDIERGVHVAPANAVLHGAVGLAASITDAEQDVLNPAGINAIRDISGRGIRVWGARTMSSDPEWKYVNIRRQLIFLEQSIARGLAWVVFEPNDEPLWGSVRRVTEDLLLAQWRTGALLGTKPEEAFFVRCDRTTMTQNDLDNGRLICLVGVAPMRPAEFVMFRIGQWTADARP